MRYSMGVLVIAAILGCIHGTWATTGAATLTPDNSETGTDSSDGSDALVDRPVNYAASGQARAPIIRLPSVDTPPVIDGNLSDSCWQAAYHDDDWWDTERDQSPQQRSKLFACVDSSNIYIAVYCYDPEPGRIRAEETKRNGDISRDDFVEIHIDPTYSLEPQRYEFSVTAIGTMKEKVPGGSDAKIEWRGDWQAAGRIVEDGWVVELAIPWEILRYPANQSVIGLAVRRHVARTERWSTWPNMGAGWDPREMARVVGLHMPTITRPTLWMPNVQMEWADGTFRTNIGLDAKKTFRNGLTGLGTWAPDYQNVEQQVETIDFSYVERLYDDRRPFFATGEGFLPDERMFYSLRIEEVDLGFKLFGRVQDTDIGALGTATFGDRNDTAVRINHSVDDLWNVSSQYVRQDVDGEPQNDVWSLGFDRYQPKGTGALWIGGEYARSSTSGASNGERWEFGLNRSGGLGRFSYGLYVSGIGPDYDARSGYEPETDRRGWTAEASYFDLPDEGLLHSYSGGIYWNRYRHYDGSLYHEDYGSWLNLQRKGHRDGLGLNVFLSDRPPHDDSITGISYFWGADELHRGGQINYSWGQLGSADYQFYSGEWSWKFRDGFYGWISYERRISDFWDPELQDVDIDRLRLRLNLDFDEERGCGVALRTGTLGTNFFVTYRQAVREGTDLFIIFGDPNTEQTRTRVAVQAKWVWK